MTLKMHSMDKVEENIKKISTLFPDALTETLDENGNDVLAIDFDILKQELSSVIVEDKEERYQFTWPDKMKSILLANVPITKTLRPCREESVNFDHTENLYIEGDNLDVLKLLQETYLGKIKMIYIDPPYNTKKDFIYKDNFTKDTGEYLASSGQFDKEGNQLVQNTERNGRFHTDWLNMMYPRLKLAKDLLSDDGAIFISIDDNELENLKKICNEIFGANNFIAQWNWYKSATPPNLSKKVKKNIEYIICYEKNRTANKYKGLKKSSVSSNGLLNQTNKIATLKFPAGSVETGLQDGIYKAGKYGTSNYEINLLRDTEVKDGIFIKEVVLQGKFKWTQSNLLNEISKGTTISIRTNAFSPSYEKKEYEPEVPPNLIDKSVGVDTTEQAGKLLTELFGGKKVFDYPKPVELIKYLGKFNCTKNDIIMDFFSGSSTTAEAVMQLNAEDGGNRKYIMVQIPEETATNSEAFKAGYKNICEIGKERIRLAGDKIENENSLDKKIDNGFRVLKLDSTNMKDIYYKPEAVKQSLLDFLTDNIKKDRTQEDLLFQVMLDLGVLLSSKIEITTISGKKVFNVADNFLIACFDEDITDEVVKAIAQKQPYYAVFRDNSIASDAVATNFEQIFATYSPTTVREVL